MIWFIAIPVVLLLGVLVLVVTKMTRAHEEKEQSNPQSK